MIKTPVQTLDRQPCSSSAGYDYFMTKRLNAVKSHECS